MTKWMGELKLKKNALRSWVSRNVGKEYGFNKNGTIRKIVLIRLADGLPVSGVTPNKITQKRARLALTFKKAKKD